MADAQKRDFAGEVEDACQHLKEFDVSWMENHLPDWVLKPGELSCFSGALQEIPCFDCYAPNCSCCCCVHPCYSEKLHTFTDFFDQVMPRLHTGDIVICSWSKEDGTASTRCLLHSKWTHVGVIYRPSDCPSILRHRDWTGASLDPSRPMTAEVLCGGQRSPASLYLEDFETMAKRYVDKQGMLQGREWDQFSPMVLGVRHLTGVKKDDEFYTKFEQCIERHWNMEYKMSTLTGFDLCQCCPLCKFEKAEDDPNSTFCSEFVAQLYMDLGIIDSKLDAAEFSPSFFDTTRHLWMHDGHLSKEHVLIGPNTIEERSAMGYPPQGEWPVQKMRRVEDALLGEDDGGDYSSGGPSASPPAQQGMGQDDTPYQQLPGAPQPQEQFQPQPPQQQFAQPQQFGQPQQFQQFGQPQQFQQFGQPQQFQQFGQPQFREIEAPQEG
eukprot:CAMPEP_0194487658 /NCGR_PEP_ID=MMETSP0253-20130528/7866_1 /TAXON_ID=2966 /ORGANISM="Noctiluca scintillans" /LENGTH=436 /DNA_ID=CAMNT_0039327913 /DNA_START=73 /DNA_END=1383 /DNA_ORIENTATION=-